MLLLRPIEAVFVVWGISGSFGRRMEVDGRSFEREIRRALCWVFIGSLQAPFTGGLPEEGGRLRLNRLYGCWFSSWLWGRACPS